MGLLYGEKAMSRRFFADITGPFVYLPKEDSEHIVRVLRLGVGARITVCDGHGTDYLCEIARAEKGITEVKAISSEPCVAEPKTKITLFQGLPKADKMELVIQKCVEIGVHEIVPVVMERTENRNRKTDKITRWNRIAESAAKQAGRGIVPKVREVVSFRESLEMASGFANKIAAYEGEKERSIKSYLTVAADTPVRPSDIALFIGPEGGFSENEVKALYNAGTATVSLGKRILRTETAGMVALAVILYEME
jgi:16S rRNA (uracil1498-N3)-methyltransferase